MMLLAVIVGGSGTVLRPGAGIGRGDSAAGMAALSARLVSGDLRLRRDRADGLPSRADCSRSPTASRPAVAQNDARPSFLEVREVRKQYGAIKAVDGVSLSVGPARSSG